MSLSCLLLHSVMFYLRFIASESQIGLNTPVFSVVIAVSRFFLCFRRRLFDRDFRNIILIGRRCDVYGIRRDIKQCGVAVFHSGFCFIQITEECDLGQFPVCEGRTASLRSAQGGIKQTDFLNLFCFDGGIDPDFIFRIGAGRNELQSCPFRADAVFFIRDELGNF